MNIVLIVLAIVVVLAFVGHLIHTVDPARVGTLPNGVLPNGVLPNGADRLFPRHPDRDTDRLRCELSAIRSYAGDR